MFGVFRMIVTTMNKEQLFSLSLPEKVAGQYWLQFDGAGDYKHSISVEGINGEWVLKSNRWVKIVDKDKTIKSVVLSPMTIIPLQNDNSENRYIFFREVFFRIDSLLEKYWDTVDLAQPI